MIKSSSNTILKVKGLKKYFPIRKGILQKAVAWVKAVDGIDLEIKHGKTLGLVNIDVVLPLLFHAAVAHVDIAADIADDVAAAGDDGAAHVAAHGYTSLTGRYRTWPLGYSSRTLYMGGVGGASTKVEFSQQVE